LRRPRIRNSRRGWRRITRISSTRNPVRKKTTPQGPPNGSWEQRVCERPSPQGPFPLGLLCGYAGPAQGEAPDPTPEPFAPWIRIRATYRPRRPRYRKRDFDGLGGAPLSRERRCPREEGIRLRIRPPIPRRSHTGRLGIRIRHCRKLFPGSGVDFPGRHP